MGHRDKPLLSSTSVSKDGFIKTEFEYAEGLLAEERSRPTSFILPLVISPCDIPRDFADYHCLILYENRDKVIAQLVQEFTLQERLDATWIVGFDLGHGESAFSYRKVMSDQTCNARFGEAYTIPTAFASGPGNKADWVGWAALRRGGNKAMINWKSDNVERIGDLGQLFVRTVLHNSLEFQAIAECPKYMYFGCPTAWGDNTRRNYEEVLSDVAPRTVRTRVISEARAALAYVRHIDETAALAQDSAVLVLDIGASTTDIAYLQHARSYPYDTGSLRLGCSLLDIAVYRRKIESYTSDLQHRRRLIGYLDEKRRRDISLQLIRCREAKERFFNSVGNITCEEQLDNAIDHSPLGAEITMRDPVTNIPISLDLTVDDVRAIRSMRLADLDNRTWEQCLEQDLVTVREQIHEGGLANPDVVILVGGGAKMWFTLDIARRVFSPATVVRPSDCHLAVSQGLTLCGALDVRVETAMMNVAMEFSNNELKQLIHRDLPFLAHKIASRTHEIVLDTTVRTLSEWCSESTTTIEDLEQRLSRGIQRSIITDTKISTILDDWKTDTYKAISQRLVAYCRRYGLPAGEVPELRFDLSPRPGGEKASQILMKRVNNSIAAIAGAILAVLGLGTPLGWVAALGLGAAGLVGSRAVLERFFQGHLRKAKVPPLLRQSLADPEQMRRRIVEDRASELERLEEDALQRLRESLAHDSLVASIQTQLRTAGKELADGIHGRERRHSSHSQFEWSRNVQQQSKHNEQNTCSTGG